jgi:hypothetical protein
MQPTTLTALLILCTATAQVSSAERAHPTDAELAHRDAAGLYSREAPFWARIADASLMTAPDSDRRVRNIDDA